jgi:hypothetical protein
MHMYTHIRTHPALSCVVTSCERLRLLPLCYRAQHKSELKVAASVTAMLLWLGVLVRAGDSYGAWTVVTYYVVPIVVFASWLVVRCAATRHCCVLSLVVVVRDLDWCSVPSLLVSIADEYIFVSPRHAIVPVLPRR